MRAFLFCVLAAALILSGQGSERWAFKLRLSQSHEPTVPIKASKLRLSRSHEPAVPINASDFGRLERTARLASRR